MTERLEGQTIISCLYQQTFLRHIIESQSTEDASRDTNEASTLTNWSSSALHSRDHWSLPGSDRTLVPTVTRSARVDSVYLLTPSVHSVAPVSSLRWGNDEELTGPSSYYATGGPWEEREVYFPPPDGAGAYSDKPSLPEHLLEPVAPQTNVLQSKSDRCRVYMETVC